MRQTVSTISNIVPCCELTASSVMQAIENWARPSQDRDALALPAVVPWCAPHCYPRMSVWPAAAALGPSTTSELCIQKQTCIRCCQATWRWMFGALQGNSRMGWHLCPLSVARAFHMSGSNLCPLPELLPTTTIKAVAAAQKFRQ